MSFYIRQESIVSQLLKDLNRIDDSSSAVQNRTASILQGNSESFVAAEDITSGDPVVLRGDGLVESAFNKLPRAGGIGDDIIVNTRLDKIVSIGSGNVQVGTLSDNTVTWSASQSYTALSPIFERAFYIQDRIIIFYLASNEFYFISGIFSGGSDTITFGTPVASTIGESILDVACTYSSSLNRLIVGYILTASDTIVRLRIVEPVAVSNNVTLNAVINVTDTIGLVNGVSGYDQISLAYAENSESLVIFCSFRTSFDFGISVVGQLNVDANTGSFFTFVPIMFPEDQRINSMANFDSVYDNVNDRVVLAFRDVYSNNLGLAMVNSVSPTRDRLVLGIAFPFTYDANNIRIFTANNKILITSSNSNDGNMYLSTLNVNSTLNTLTLDSSFPVISSTSSEACIVYHPSSDKIIYNGPNQYKVFKITSPFRSPFQFIGFSNESRNIGEIITVSLFGINDKQTGLTTGLIYYVAETSLSTTVSTIKAGLAISASEIKVANPLVIYE